MAWDRYSYAINSPISLTDPSGHMYCDGADEQHCQIRSNDLVAAMNVSFHWNIEGDWNRTELSKLLDIGIRAENKIDGFTNGNGRGWMITHMGDVNSIHNNFLQRVVLGVLSLPSLLQGGGKIPGAVPTGNGTNVYLDSIGLDFYHVVHELGHVIDNNSGDPLCVATWCGGGMADQLYQHLGGKPSGVRWINGVQSLQRKYQWSTEVDDGYGNKASSEYFAQAFAYLLIDQSRLPNSNVVKFLMDNLFTD